MSMSLTLPATQRAKHLTPMPLSCRSWAHWEGVPFPGIATKGCPGAPCGFVYPKSRNGSSSFLWNYFVLVDHTRWCSLAPRSQETNPSAILRWRFMGSVDSYIIIIMTLLNNSIIIMTNIYLSWYIAKNFTRGKLTGTSTLYWYQSSKVQSLAYKSLH